VMMSSITFLMIFPVFDPSLFLSIYFIDDVMFAHKPRLLDVAAQLKCSAHAALGLAINCAQ